MKDSVRPALEREYRYGISNLGMCIVLVAGFVAKNGHKGQTKLDFIFRGVPR